MRNLNRKQTTTDLRTAFEAGRLSAYFDRAAGTKPSMTTPPPTNDRGPVSDLPGEEWHH